MSNRVLAAACVLLLVGIAVAVRAPVTGSAPATRAQAQTPLVPSAPAMPAMPPAATYADVVSRPLFVRGRRGPDGAGAEADVAAPIGTLGSYKLLGVTLTTDGRWALVLDTRTQKARRLTAGATLDGWRVELIEAERVVFDGGGRDRGRSELRLQRAAPIPPTAAHLAAQRQRAGSGSKSAPRSAAAPAVDPRTAALRGFALPSAPAPTPARPPRPEKGAASEDPR